MTARIEHLVTAGTFNLDGGSWDVENNVWLVGNDAEVILIDAPHDADAILEAVGDRDLLAIACTHAHDDHVNAAGELSERTGAPILLHPDDAELWQLTYPHRVPDRALADGVHLDVAGTALEVIHTPGHAPGAVCFYAPRLKSVFAGDTLFRGGPGATGRSYSDFDTIIASITDRLLSLPPETTVFTGHGESTTIGDEQPDVDLWLQRGH